MDRSIARPVPLFVHYAALGIASLSLFLGTTTAYYHFVRLGQAVEQTPLRSAVIGIHDFLGVWGVLALAAFPFLWPVIFFFRERIGGLKLKAFGWICTTGFVSILGGVVAGEASGGSFGGFVGGKLHAAMGEGLALIVCLVALGMALFLATERFFSLPTRPHFDVEPQRTAEASGSGISAEESKQITEEPRFDLEKVLEIEEEEDLTVAVAPPPIFAPVPEPTPALAPAPVIPPVPEEAASIPEPTPVVEEDVLPTPPTPRAEQKAEELEEAVERATKDFVLPPPPAPAPAPSVPAAEPPANASMLDGAARLVIQEGRASVSLLQRRLSIPFSRAALLLDLLEREGVIGPYRGGPSRDILLSLADWEQKHANGSPNPSALPQA